VYVSTCTYRALIKHAHKSRPSPRAQSTSSVRSSSFSHMCVRVCAHTTYKYITHARTPRSLFIMTVYKRYHRPGPRRSVGRSALRRFLVISSLRDRAAPFLFTYTCTRRRVRLKQSITGRGNFRLTPSLSQTSSHTFHCTHIVVYTYIGIRL